jgi:hypothetical protein
MAAAQCWTIHRDTILMLDQHGSSGAVPAIGNEPSRSTLPVALALLARPPDIALFLAFLA